MVHVIRNYQRPSKELVAQLGSVGAATLHEAQGGVGALDSRLKPIYSGMSTCGPAFTVKCHPGDNLMLQAAISYAEAGDVLVVDAGDYTESGGFGDVMANACVAKGIAALVMNACVRDGLDLKRLRFPVFSYGLCMKGTVKETIGTLNHPVVVGGVHVRPGDIVRADDDGVVVVARERGTAVLEAARRRQQAEAEKIRALRAGGDLLALGGRDTFLKQRGLIVEGDEGPASLDRR